MSLADIAYPTLVYVHLLLFVFWLGGDVGVFLLGQHFRKRNRYALGERLVLLRMLVLVDMVPRSAWALMVPVSLSVLAAGGWWAVPPALLLGAWIVGGVWLWLTWDIYLHDGTPRAHIGRRIEVYLKLALTFFYLGIGTMSLATGQPLVAGWLATKALLFGAIFVAAMLIDYCFRPVGGQLARLIAEGSSDVTERPLRRTMDRTRIWVLAIYLLLIATSWLGAVKPAW